MDGVKQQDSTPQNDSTLGFKWIKKNRAKKKDRTWLKYELHCNHCVSLTPEIVYQASGRTMTDHTHEVRIS
jgi:hypothetical protein